MARKHERVSHLNIGLIIFGLLLVYLITVFVLYLKTDKVRAYQVLEGSLSMDNIYEGIALRSEAVVESPLSGYVNYFATEGSRVAVGNLVYTVDESGNLLDYLQAQGAGNFSLSESDLSELRTQIVNYEADFDRREFHTVYEFKNTLSGTINKLANAGVLSNIESLNESSASQTIRYCRAEDTGIVIYSTDGYESLSADQITEDTFTKENYEKRQLSSNALVETGDAVYKLCTDDNWSIVIPVSEETGTLLEELSYIKVKFLKNQDVSWASTRKFTDEAGNVFVELQFNNSMHVFCNERFISIELMLTEDSGLKIPVSAIVNRRFYLIPKEFVVNGADGSYGILRRTYLENGTETAELVDVEVYNETETMYYLDDVTVEAGDVILKEESEETFTVGTQESLVGVYNINKGYADFKQIHVLYDNEEYAIVESNTRYGLSPYDYIVLDAETVQENDMIYN